MHRLKLDGLTMTTNHLSNFFTSTIIDSLGTAQEGGAAKSGTSFSHNPQRGIGWIVEARTLAGMGGAFILS